MSSNAVIEAAKGHTVIVGTPGHEGVVITMNAVVAQEDLQTYIQECQAIQKRFKAHPDNLFCVITTNPRNPRHVRLVHGWPYDSAWYNKTFFQEPWFVEYIQKVKDMWTEPRLIEHFDLV